VLASLERDVFPALGEQPISAIDAPALLPVLEEVEGRGCLATAKRVRQRLSGIFRYGIARRLCDADPAAIVAGAFARAATAPASRLAHDRGLPPVAGRRRSRAGARPVKLASRFLALTAVRLDAVRGIRWGELEGLDGDEPLWRVPAARMKLAKVKKDDRRFDHVVPLSQQSLQVLCHAARENGCDTLPWRPPTGWCSRPALR
jgi:integrase